MRISRRSGILKRQGNRAMTKNLKKGQRIGRNPKTGTEVPISPRRVMVFKPSAVLKQRINGHNPGNGEVKTD
jgi:nucleoid DNA-binding protein